MTCSLDYNYRLNSSHSLKVQQLHFNQKTKKERKRIVLHFSLSHTPPHKHTHPQCIPTWLPLCLLFTLWDEQILGCNFYFLPLPSASLITAIISVLSCGKLWQWWFRAFGACESVNVCAWGCVTNVAVCWALHALIVRCRGCAYTQSLMRGRVRVWRSCRSFQRPEGLLGDPILLGQFIHISKDRKNEPSQLTKENRHDYSHLHTFIVKLLL